jgi:murein tripeptide amidase MpaA
VRASAVQEDAMPYLNVTEVETALAVANGQPNATITQLISLPNQTWEGRACHALKIANGSGAGRPGIYFIGGVHAREWGSADILIFFVEQLLQAYQANRGIRLGNTSFSAAQIQQIVNTKDIFIFPQVNPDGRQYSMTVDPDWRMNRRPAGNAHPACLGVDINRNYDFLWDFPVYFDPRAPIANSQDPCDPQYTYIGPAPFSEPETKNVVWMLDTYPNIHYFIDIHSYSDDILYFWGDDNNHVVDQMMSFQNAAYNGKRGIANDGAYREYIDPADQAAIVTLANQMRDAIKGVRGRTYTVEQSLSLYPTAGTSDDYAFSRHLMSPPKPKIFAYTIEWGSSNNATPFHPRYTEMQKIIREVTAGLLDFCVRAT